MAAIFVILAALSFIKSPFNGYWKSRNIFNSRITKIKLSSYPEAFGGWVEFSDNDLIQNRVDYLNSVELQHSLGPDASSACAVCFPRDGGAYDTVTVYTENSMISLTFYDSKTVQFGNSLRLFNVSGGEYPFDDIYKKAEERHGLTR